MFVLWPQATETTKLEELWLTKTPVPVESISDFKFQAARLKLTSWQWNDA
jgi:hypothetical protein